MKNLFIHLRLHSNFSLAEGMLSFDDLSKFCVENKFKKGCQSNYVLDNWNFDEQNVLNKLVEKSSNIIIQFCLFGIDEAMRQSNQ